MQKFFCGVDFRMKRILFFLKSSLEERIKRDKKKLYKPALNGEKKFVVDVDIPFEKPTNANLVIETENETPEKIAKKIVKELNI